MSARHITRGHFRWMLPLLLLVVSAACGNLTPGGLAETTVSVTGDADAPPAAALVGAAAAAPAAVRGAADPASTDDDDAVEGEIEIVFALYLVRADGSLHRLGEPELQAQVDLRGRTEADVVNELVPAGLFTDLRIVFTEIEVQVQGLVIDGVPIPDVQIELDDVELVSTRPLNLTIDDGDRVELLVDLNALAWLDAVDPDTGVVDDSVFEGLINVAVR